MINHISPFYTVAAICAIACVVALLADICMIDWEMVLLRWKSRQNARRQEECPEWADEDKWEESK